MTTRGRWQNEEMWREATQRRRGGDTYRAIAGWLARAEIMCHFRLQEAPSEDTVGREVQKRLEGSVLPGLPALRLDEPQAAWFTDYIGTARYATVGVHNRSEVEARECWGLLEVLQPPERKVTFELHWAGLKPSPHEVGVPRIAILPGLTARLDVAFTLPLKAGTIPQRAVTSGVISMATYVTGGPGGSTRSGTPELPQEGCWLAWPMAIFNPLAGTQAYLAPGRYLVLVTVGCEEGQGDSKDILLLSPARGQELRVEMP